VLHFRRPDDRRFYRLRSCARASWWRAVGRRHARRRTALPVSASRSVSRGRRPRKGSSRRTIVLVAWLTSPTRTTMLPLHAYLKASSGFGPVLSFDYAVVRGHRAVGGARAQAVLQGGGCAAGASIWCATRSAEWWRAAGCRSSAGARRVDRCITLSSPHRGTYGAYWVASRGGDASCGRTRRSCSGFEGSRGAAERVKFTSVVAGSDNIVFPARLRLARGSWCTSPTSGHVGMLFSPTVLRAVADRL